MTWCSGRDADMTTAIHSRLPVPVDQSSFEEARAVVDRVAREQVILFDPCLRGEAPAYSDVALVVVEAAPFGVAGTVASQ